MKPKYIERVRNLLLVGCITCLFMGCSKEAGKAKAAEGSSRRVVTIPVAVAPIVVQDAIAYYTTTTTLEAEQNARILARTTGAVRELLAEEGDRVVSDQVLLRLEDDDQQLRLKQAQIALIKTENDFERNKNMKEAGILADEDYERTVNDLRQAQAERDLAELNLSYTLVRAPFSGKVVIRHIDLGANVSPGTELFQLMDVHPLLLKLHIPSERLNRVQVGQVVNLTQDKLENSLQSVVRLISPIVDPSTGTVKVTAELNDYPESIRPGDFVEARVSTNLHPNAMMVPSVAVIEEQNEHVVYVVVDGMAQRRVVQVGFVENNLNEIRNGLQPGERVVVKGQRNLRDGAKVEILEGPGAKKESQHPIAPGADT